MTAALAEIWRHPIKALGRERVALARLRPGDSLPFDRHWGVLHGRAKPEDATDDGWMKCLNFIRGESSPSLMAITCELDELREQITLRHPDRPEITLHPERDEDELLEWVAPLTSARTLPVSVVSLPGRGFTDSGTAGVTIASYASHKAVEGAVGYEISRARWRANLWLDGLAAWEEMDWLDRDIRIGSAVLRVYGRTERCRATHASPETGELDLKTLQVLREFGHRDFSVKAKIIEAGHIAEGDEIEVL